MRVLMLTIDFPPQTIGGEGIVAAKIATLLRDRGVDLEIVAPLAADCSVFDQSIGVPVHRVPICKSNFVTRTLSFAWNTRELVRRYQGDLIYAFRPVVPPPELPMVSHFHTTRKGEALGAMRSGSTMAAIANFLLVPTERLHARNSTMVLGVNARMETELGLRDKHCPPFLVIPNGIDCSRFDPSPRTRTGARLLYVGRLDPRKGILHLLEALRGLSTAHHDLTLTVVGSGPQDNAIRTFARRHGLSDRVHLVGNRPFERMPEIYRAHDLLVLPSLYEPFGLVILEAMASATAVITSDACAVFGQRTYPAGNSVALAVTIRRFIENRHELAAEALRGPATAASHRWDLVASQLLTCFVQAKASGQ